MQIAKQLNGYLIQFQSQTLGHKELGAVRTKLTPPCPKNVHTGSPPLVRADTQ